MIQLAVADIFHSLIFVGRLPWEVIFIWSIWAFCFGVLSQSLKIEYYPLNGCWDIPLLILWGRLPLEVVSHWRLSSIGVRLHLKNLYKIVWSSKPKFIIWVGSNKCLLRYSTLNIMRSSSMWGRLPCEVVFIWSIWTLCFGHLSLSLKF
jgi:hypothetical protein